MTGQFKKTFQTIYLDEICYFFICICTYIWCYLYKKHNMVLIMQETMLIRLRKILDYFFTHYLKSPFIRENWTLIRREFAN